MQIKLHRESKAQIPACSIAPQQLCYPVSPNRNEHHKSSGGEAQPARKADLIANCGRSVGASTSYNSTGLHNLLYRQIYLCLCNGTVIKKIQTGCRKPFVIRRRSRKQSADYVIPNESASELYRLSDRLLSAKLVPTFAERGVA
jgi:hypothetical protein